MGLGSGISFQSVVIIITGGEFVDNAGAGFFRHTGHRGRVGFQVAHIEGE